MPSPITFIEGISENFASYILDQKHYLLKLNVFAVRHSKKYYIPYINSLELYNILNKLYKMNN